MQKVHTALMLAAAATLSALANAPALAQSAIQPPAAAGSPEPLVAQSATVPPAANPDTQFDKQRFETEVVKSKDLPNFHEVHPFLFRGGEPTAAGLEQLKAKGISKIIDLRGGDKSKEEAIEAKRLGLVYINLPMSAEPPTKSQVDKFTKTVEHAEAHPQDGSVYVHCAHGSDRTGCLVGIWRVTRDGWSYPEAYKEMRHYWFTPKFVKLSGAVEQFATVAHKDGRKASALDKPQDLTK